MFEKVGKCYSCTKPLWCMCLKISILQGPRWFSEGSSAGYFVRPVPLASICIPQMFNAVHSSTQEH